MCSRNPTTRHLLVLFGIHSGGSTALPAGPSAQYKTGILSNVERYNHLNRRLDYPVAKMLRALFLFSIILVANSTPILPRQTSYGSCSLNGVSGTCQDTSITCPGGFNIAADGCPHIGEVVTHPGNMLTYRSNVASIINRRMELAHSKARSEFVKTLQSLVRGNSMWAPRDVHTSGK